MIRTRTPSIGSLLAVFALALALALPLAGCGDPCQQLAEKICQCEPGVRAQEACRLDFQTQQQNQPAPNEEQQDACVAAELTCTCEALDNNRTDMCGFARGDEQ